MNQEKDFNFEITLSTKGYDHKPNANDYKMMKWSVKNIIVSDFIVFISKGHSYCHIYRNNHRSNNDFLYTNIVSIDIDDSTVPMETYVDGLMYKPTFAYTTPSDGVKGYRFRLVYVFSDKITDTVYENLYYQILDVNGLSIKDNCGRTKSQLMNGNGTSNCRFYSSGSNGHTIYCISDFIREDRIPPVSEHSKDSSVHDDADNRGVRNWTSNMYCMEEEKNNLLVRKRTTKSQQNQTTTYADKVLKYTKDIDFASSFIETYTSTITDFNSLDYDDFYSSYSCKNFPIYTSTTINYNENGYYRFSEGEEYYQLYTQFARDQNGRFYIKKFGKGQNRKKKLFSDCCIIRKIDNDISFDNLLYNMVYRFITSYDNRDGLITKDRFLDTVLRVYCMDIDEIKCGVSKHPMITTNKVYCELNGLNRKKYSQKCRRRERYIDIGEWYDCNLSVKENHRIAVENGWFDKSIKTLERFCIDNGLCREPRKLDISDWYDSEKSVKENLEYAKENGIKVGRTKLYEYQRKLRSGL